MNLSFRTQVNTKYGSVTEYHSIEQADQVEIDVAYMPPRVQPYVRCHVTKGVANLPDTFMFYIGDACIQLNVGIWDRIVECGNLAMKQYDDRLHEEQLEDERSTNVK